VPGGTTARTLAPSKEAFDAPLSPPPLDDEPGPATGRSGAYPDGTLTRWSGPAFRTQQAAILRKLKRKGGELWRAYTIKEALRAVFAGDLAEAEVAELLDRFCSRASRSGLKEFVTVANTIRKHRAGILAAVRLGINNARHEGLNRRVRLIVNRAYGFHSPRAALALIMVTLGPINHVLPHERTPVPTG